MVRQRFEVLHNGGEIEFVTCAGETAQAHPLEAVTGLQVESLDLEITGGFLASIRDDLVLNGLALIEGA
jgi:hypothetical protein